MENKAKILVIEDEQYIRENIQELLEAKGYLVRTAINGKQGILEAIDYRPALIICDVMMPKMDGFKVLEQIRKTSSIQNTPFIFLTAKIDKLDVRQGMDLGADDYITKPFTAKELTAAIESRLRRQDKMSNQYAKVKHDIETSVFATYYHEFNMPLQSIINSINLLLSAGKSFTEKQIQDSHVSILKSALRLNHSLSNLMLFEEIKRAEVHPELTTMFSNGQSGSYWHHKINDELQTIAKEIYKRPDGDLVIEFNNVTDLGINFDFLLRMLVEVTSNALKYSSPGQKVNITGNRVNDDYIIEITDQGQGFPIQSIDEIQPFKQFGKKRFEQQGLGLGLYLVKQLIGFNSGDFKIESVEEQGTKVTIALPILEMA